MKIFQILKTHLIALILSTKSYQKNKYRGVYLFILQVKFICYSSYLQIDDFNFFIKGENALNIQTLDIIHSQSILNGISNEMQDVEYLIEVRIYYKEKCITYVRSESN